MMKVLSKGLPVVFFLILSLICSGLLQAVDGIDNVSDYYDMLASGNFQSAGYMWLESSRERSERFGIEYIDIPLKLDCTSPIVRNLDVMRDYLQPPVKTHKKLDPENYLQYVYGNVVNGSKVEHTFYAYFDSSYYWFIYPQDYYARSWPVVETEFFRIHVHPDVHDFLNQVNKSAIDNFVLETTDKIMIDKSVLAEINQKKIEYYYCDADSTVEKITGYRIKGTFDLASNDIISAFFPHYHELSHFLINLKLKKQHMYTIPLLREGIAVKFGGRWGKAPSTLTDLGVFIYKNQILEIDSIITMKGFENNAGSDIAYPIAGLFIDFLMDKIGQEKFFELYRNLSGDFEALYKMDNNDIKQEIVSSTGDKSWEKLLQAFDAYIDNDIVSKAVIIPIDFESKKADIVSDNFLMDERGDWLYFQFWNDPDKPLSANLMFSREDDLTGKRSLLFEEQYQGRVSYEGYRYGIRFDRNEIGVYDYGANMLTGKYIQSLSPSEAYFDEAENKVSVKVKKSLFGKTKPEKGNFKLLVE